MWLPLWSEASRDSVRQDLSTSLFSKMRIFKPARYSTESVGPTGAETYSNWYFSNQSGEGDRPTSTQRPINSQKLPSNLDVRVGSLDFVAEFLFKAFFVILLDVFMGSYLQLVSAPRSLTGVSFTLVVRQPTWSAKPLPYDMQSAPPATTFFLGWWTNLFETFVTKTWMDTNWRVFATAMATMTCCCYCFTGFQLINCRAVAVDTWIAHDCDLGGIYVCCPTSVSCPNLVIS